ncbi:Uncharacterised protein [Salmonella enterica subsp. enterica serovar Bovismorbificans]|uniref:Uncharacterized protein n=1 Tax=Salmonella enterica subsp. enterica serovar Bovismorbificans TaxID=58097 RepID=A0A655C5C7_SALET|nr:Uncharacterised protein [Salmonella enterica subsp. enterica serovar Bovismorbificans]
MRAQRLVGRDRIGVGVAKKVMPHRLIRFTKHHNRVIAQRVVIAAHDMRLRTGMGRECASGNERSQADGNKVEFHFFAARLNRSGSSNSRSNCGVTSH